MGIKKPNLKKGETDNLKSKIKSILWMTFFLLFVSQTINGQIFNTRTEIIKEYGDDYSTGLTDDGTKYISYDTKMITNASGSYTQTKAMYFRNINDGSEICIMWKIIEPSSETNSNVSYYKSKLVQISKMQWKDYETNIIYDIVVENGLCIVTAWWDNEK